MNPVAVVDGGDGKSQKRDEEDRRQRGQAMKRPDTPFPRHWRYYIVLKYVVLAAAVALALKYFGVW